MYVPNGTFGEIIAYITGFEMGLDFGEAYLEGELARFNRWMAEKFGVPSNWVWWSTLLTGLGNDTKRALQDLPKLYEEFLGSAGEK